VAKETCRKAYATDYKRVTVSVALFLTVYKKLLHSGKEYPIIGIKPGRTNSHQSETNLIKTPEATLPGALWVSF
jgi:hypothetical protein